MALKIGIIGSPPFVNPCWRNACSKPGILIEICNLFCSQYNLTCKFSNENVTNSSNMSWDNGIQDVSDGLYDTAVPAYTPTAARAALVDFSDTIFYIKLVLVFRVPPPSQLSFSRLLALDWKVWLCISACATIIGIILSVAECRNASKKFASRSLFHCLNAFALLTSQNQDLDPFLVGTRILVTFWALSAVIISGQYSGNLLSFLLKTKISFPFYNFDDFVSCVERNECRLAVASVTSSYIAFLQYSNVARYYRLGQALNKYPPLVKPSKDIPDYILGADQPILVWLTSEPTFYSMTNNNQNCTFAKIDTDMMDRYNFPINKNSRYKQLIQNFSKSIRNYGIQSKFYRRYSLRDTDTCQMNQIDEGQPLPLTAVFSLLFVLVIGYSISFFVFCVEKLRKYFSV